MPTDKILGIDLGTTNTSFGVIENGEPTIIPNQQGEKTMPSVVSFKPDGEKLVGKPALNQAISNPQRTISSIKRKMGREDYKVDVGVEEFKPEEISGFILRRVKEDAEDYVGEEITRAVITVPAYFTDKQRQSTKQAGELAGFEVERIINEPTAASISYGIDDDTDQTILVFDLGGGTFDVSVLDLGNGVYDVIATNGNARLGGDDWDQLLVDHYSEKFEEEHGVSLKNDPQAKTRLEEAAEEAKITLSTKYRAQTSLPFITTTDDGGISLEDSITREHFNRLATSLIQKLEDPVQQVMEDGGVTSSDIDDVILVGGSTRMPMVRDKVEEMFGIQPKSHIEPDKAVALGATVQGGLITGETEDAVLLDVTPLTLGIEVQGGLFEPLIPRNSTLPAEASKVYTTTKDGQRSVYIRVFQGEDKVADRNEYLDEFVLSGIPKAEAGTPQIEVTFEIDLDGIVNVTAHELASGAQKQVRITGGSGFDDDQLEDMKERQERVEKVSRSQKRNNQIRTRAEELISAGEEVVSDTDISLGARMANDIEDLVADMQQALDQEDPDMDEVENMADELNQLVGEVKAVA